MSPAGRALGYVILFVEDLAASVPFYRDVVGFEHKFTDAGYAEFATGAARFALFERRRAEWMLGTAARPGPAAEVVVMVDDVDAEATRLVAASVPLLAAPTDRPWGHRTLHLADPDGFVVELAQEVTRRRSRGG